MPWAGTDHRPLRLGGAGSDSGKGKRLALVIGCGDYSGTHEFPRSTGGASAEAIHETLVGRVGVAPEDAVLLADCDGPDARPPTLAAVRSALGGVLDRARPEDTVFVYFAGHALRALGRTYLETRESREADPAGTAIDTEWLHSTVRASKAGIKVVWLDACFAGLPALRPEIQAGEYTLTACAAEEICVELAGKFNLMTYFLVQGLCAGGSEPALGVSWKQLATFVRRRTAEAARAMGVLQEPEVLGPPGSDFRLVAPGTPPIQPRSPALARILGTPPDAVVPLALRWEDQLRDLPGRVHADLPYGAYPPLPFGERSKAFARWTDHVGRILDQELAGRPGLAGWRCDATRIEGLGASRDLATFFAMRGLSLLPDWSLAYEGEAVFFEEPESLPPSSFILSRHGPRASTYWAGMAVVPAKIGAFLVTGWARLDRKRRGGTRAVVFDCSALPAVVSPEIESRTLERLRDLAREFLAAWERRAHAVPADDGPTADAFSGVAPSGSASPGEFEAVARRWEGDDRLGPLVMALRRCYLEARVPEDLDRELAGSDPALVRELERESGIGLMQWVVWLRLAKACRLLATSTHRGEEIALLAGYQSAAAFASQFAAFLGCSPESWRSGHYPSLRSERYCER